MTALVQVRVLVALRWQLVRLNSAAACTALVVALCLSAAARRPCRADLNGSRDAVAPPGPLVLASARLAGLLVCLVW